MKALGLLAVAGLVLAGAFALGWTMRGRAAAADVAAYQLALAGTTDAYVQLAGRTRADGAAVRSLADSVRQLAARLAVRPPATRGPGSPGPSVGTPAAPASAPGAVQTSADPTPAEASPTLWEALRASCADLADRCTRLAFRADSALAQADTALAQRDSAFARQAVVRASSFRTGAALGGGLVAVLTLVALLLHH